MTPFNPQIGRVVQDLEPRALQRTIIALPVTEITATTAGSAQVVLTVPDDQFFHLSSFKVCNTTGGAVTFNLHIVPSGSSASDANLLYSSESIPPNDTVTLAERNTIMVPEGSTIEVHAGSANDLNLIMWGALIASGDPL